jgi:hypothetical protein
MKYLQDYINEKQTAALEKAGAFFAFSTKQFEEQKKKGVTYVNGPAGMICPKNTIESLMQDLKNIYKDGIQQDIKENGLEAIIKRELNNHEAYYTRDIETTVEALSEYPVTRDEILAVFRNKNYQLEHAA